MPEVTWNETICIHAGHCVNGLPAVFKVGETGLEIDAAAASEDEIRAAVANCPSGALQLKD